MTPLRLEEPNAPQPARISEIEPLYGGLSLHSQGVVQTITESRALGGEREETWVQGMAPQSLTMGPDESFSSRVSAFPSVQ